VSPEDSTWLLVDAAIGADEQRWPTTQVKLGPFRKMEFASRYAEIIRPTTACTTDNTTAGDAAVCTTTHATTLCSIDVDNDRILSRCSPGNFLSAFDAWFYTGAVLLGLLVLHLFTSAVFVGEGMPLVWHSAAEIESMSVDRREIYRREGELIKARGIGSVMNIVRCIGIIILAVCIVIVGSIGDHSDVFHNDQCAFHLCDTQYGTVIDRWRGGLQVSQLTSHRDKRFHSWWHLNRFSSPAAAMAYITQGEASSVMCALRGSKTHKHCGVCDPAPIIVPMCLSILVIAAAYELYGALYSEMIYPTQPSYRQLSSIDHPPAPRDSGRPTAPPPVYTPHDASAASGSTSSADAKEMQTFKHNGRVFVHLDTQTQEE
jgi:hypothetical protein